MKKFIVALAVAGALAPSLSQAQVQIDMMKVTCGEALAMAPDDQADFAAFMSGFFSQKAGRTTINLSLFQKNVASVLDWCKSNKDQSVMVGLERATGVK